MSRYLPRIGTLGGGASPVDVTDHFAPTIIVGNTLAGDPAVAQVAPFRYIPDPGDGTGIQTALAEATALGTGAWVHIRRGTYTLAAAVLPLAISSLVRVTGDGTATVLIQRADDRRVFTMAGFGPVLERLTVQQTRAAAGAAGATMIDAFASAVARVQNVLVTSLVAPDINLKESLTSVIGVGATALVQSVYCSGVDANPNGNGVAIIFAGSTGCVVADCDLFGGDYGVRIGPVAAECRVAQNRVDGTNASGTSQIGIYLAANLATCVGNLSRDTAVGIASDGVGSTVSANAVTAAGSAIVLNGTSSNNAVIGNTLNGGVVTDLGVGNDVAHNP